MEAGSETVELGIQLLLAAGMMFAMALIHGLGLEGGRKVLNLKKDRLKEHDFDLRGVALMGSIASCLFVLHMAEIVIFALFYYTVSAIQTLEEVLYYSASAYATLGRTAEYFPDEWRLMGAIEALIGFLLLGWSTAFVVRHVGRLRD